MNLDQQFDDIRERLAAMESRIIAASPKSNGTGNPDNLQYAFESIAAIQEWTATANADYTRVLAELSELKQRIAKLEGEGQ